MNPEKILKNLEELGFSETEAQLYALLGKKGPQRARDLVKALRISRQRLYLILKELERKGFINSTLEHPAKFTAEPFEKVLDLFIKSRLTEARSIENRKVEILSDWRSISIKDNDDALAKFKILEGRNYVYPKLRQMVEDTTAQLSIALDIADLMKLDQFGIIDIASTHSSKTDAEIKILAGSSQENIKIAEKILGEFPNSSNFRKKIMQTDSQSTPRMVIKDGEVIFFVNSDRNNDRPNSKETCLWTNSSAIVESFKVLFDNLWNSLPIEEKNSDNSKSGKVGSDSFNVQQIRSYKEMFESAEFEIFTITSSEGLIKISKELSNLKLLSQKGVAIRIMAPILGNNLKEALKLSEICQIKHVSLGYFETTVLDNKHLFQFRSPHNGASKQNIGQLVFDKLLHTADIEYVQKTKSLMEEIWKNSIAPSKITFKEMSTQQFPATPPVPSDELTCIQKDSPYQKSLIAIEENLRQRPTDYVLNKLINAKKVHVRNPLSRVSYSFGCMASAIIHPPKSLILPDMIISACHWNKQTTFGEEDWLFIQLLTDAPNGRVFVPSVIVSDNPKSMETRKSVYGGTPAAENYHILKKSQLSVELHGTTLSAIWSEPIVLSVRGLVLPAGAILFEGYGSIKSIDAHYVFPSGWEASVESNGLEAFVTYFHPALKYSGPATDGTMSRDCVATIYPPNCKPNYP